VVAHPDDVLSARASPSTPSAPSFHDEATAPLSDAASDSEREHRIADSSAPAVWETAPADEAAASSASDPAALVDDPVVVDVTLEPEDFARLDIRADPVAMDPAVFDAQDSLVVDASDRESIERPPRPASGVARALLWMFAVFALLALAAGGVYVLNKQHRLDHVLDVLGISHPSSARTAPESAAKDARVPAATIAPSGASTSAPPSAAPAGAAALPSPGAAAPPAAPSATPGGATLASPPAAGSAAGETTVVPVESLPVTPTSPAVAPVTVTSGPVPATANPTPNAQNVSPNAQNAVPNAQSAAPDQPTAVSNTPANPHPAVQPPAAARASPAAPARPVRHPAETRSTAPAPRAAAAREPPSPRDACGGRTEFALYRCMQTQCGSPQWASHPQCERLRRTDRVE
jgi:hypothetical protein